MDTGDLDRLLRVAPGFGLCRRCTYFQAGSQALCYRCAQPRLAPLVPPSRRCQVCDQPFERGMATCENPVCKMTEAERGFEWNFSIAMHTGMLKTAIHDYKRNGVQAWALIFGRILVGFLDMHLSTFENVDLFVPSPVYVGPGAPRSWDHIRTIVEAAEREQQIPAADGGWPLDTRQPGVIVKTARTASLSGLPSASARKREAEQHLRPALRTPDTSLTRGRSIVVIDDVFTGGWTLREVALALRDQGEAAHVYGASLARQPFDDDDRRARR